MSVQLAKELRIELHYGLDYIDKVLEDGPNKTNATAKLVEARSAMASYISANQNQGYFKDTLNNTNEVIEMDPDVVMDSDLAKVDGSSSVKDIKICINGLGMAVDKVMKLRMGKMSSMDPSNAYRSLRSLDRAVDAIESSIGFLFNELHDISKKNPGLYPTFQSEEKGSSTSSEERTIPSEAVKTDTVMESRAAAKIPAKEITPGKEKNAKKAEEVDHAKKGVTDAPADAKGPANDSIKDKTTESSDPTEGFSEDLDNNPKTTGKQ